MTRYDRLTAVRSVLERTVAQIIEQAKTDYRELFRGEMPPLKTEFTEVTGGISRCKCYVRLPNDTIVMELDMKGNYERIATFWIYGERFLLSLLKCEQSLYSKFLAILTKIKENGEVDLPALTKRRWRIYEAISKGKNRLTLEMSRKRRGKLERVDFVIRFLVNDGNLDTIFEVYASDRGVELDKRIFVFRIEDLSKFSAQLKTLLRYHASVFV